ncbi:alanine racemase [Fontivita pretiosa]|uniref:alanine racemase n=1 Tax=Fontivita pretiosa TaxID=2989684 RepID=UPI003D1829F4
MSQPAYTLESVPTPAVVIDLPTVRRNIARLAEYCRRQGLGLRPHTKTHKSLFMAQLQMQAGAIGLTVAKAGEAEVMRQASQDVLVAYPALDAARCRRLAELAADGTMVRVAVDSTFAADVIAEHARRYNSQIGILVDLDVGFHRTGVQSPEAATQLARHVSRTPGLRLDGIMIYPGHVHEPADQQGDVLRGISQLLIHTIEQWHRAGLETKIVSGGSTPTACQSHLIPQLTEIRPGTYIYNDTNYMRGGYCGVEDCAARVVCTVVSDAVPGKFVIDAGSKALTSDRNWKDPDSGFGHIVEYAQAKITRLSEEHGEVDASRCDRRPKLGQRVTVIPNHICPCINLHDAVWLKDENETTLRRLPVDARGRVS